MTFPRSLFVLLTLGLCALSVCGTAVAQGLTVTLQVKLQEPTHARESSLEPGKGAAPERSVAWLTPLGTTKPSRSNDVAPTRDFTLAQKNKQFIPHLLVVPTGSNVDFPNFDPFFHNVFSLYNGRRFDLGLYEKGSRRSVRFAQDGVSYIFCNIHPEMGAVVISLSTPYYGISNAAGVIEITNLHPGDYELNLWSENGSPEDAAAARRRIHISTESLHLPPIVLRRVGSLLDHHANKFGEPYEKPDQNPY